MPGQLLEFYGLREHPFGVSPNPRYLYLSRQHREALATLIAGIENFVGFSALIAEPGVGKTMLLFEILRQFKERASTALISNTQCSGLELLRCIVMSLGISGGESEQDPVRLYHLLTTFASERQHTKPVVIIIDEAQDLEDSALETLRLLSNFEAADRKLLHIILAGQPELGEKLRSKRGKQLSQRITIVTRLGRLSPEETAECIAFRLRTAGYSESSLFSNEAMAKIKQASGGVPREINRICINALETGFALRKKQIGIKIIEQVVSDLDLSCAPPQTDQDIRQARVEAGLRVGHIELESLERSTEPAASPRQADAWVIDPLIDVGLGDEVIDSVLSGLEPNGNLTKGSSNDPQTSEIEAAPHHPPQPLHESDKPRISYAHAGLGPSDDEIQTLLSEISLSGGTLARTPQVSPAVEHEPAAVEPKDSSTPVQPDIPTPPADPRVLKIFAPRKNPVSVKRTEPQTSEPESEPVVFRVREEPWVTGVPIDQWARGSFSSHEPETPETSETPAQDALIAKGTTAQKRPSKVNPILMLLAVVFAALVFLYAVIPFLSR